MKKKFKNFNLLYSDSFFFKFLVKHHSLFLKSGGQLFLQNPFNTFVNENTQLLLFDDFSVTTTNSEVLLTLVDDKNIQNNQLEMVNFFPDFDDIVF